jgi:hypothetical protein
MDAPIQSILVPVIKEVPHSAIRYAELLSEAYSKPISLLCFDASLVSKLEAYGHYVAHSTEKLNKAIEETLVAQDCVMIVWANFRKWNQTQGALSACRDLRIPYFFIPNTLKFEKPNKVTLPIGFLIEEREKATWGRSLNRYFGSQFTILQPNDKGSRAAKNVTYVEEFFEKNSIPFRTYKGKKSSFKIEKEALMTFSESTDLLVLTASRDYGLDDQYFGPKELWLIKMSNTPLMLLNPRDDLYVLCGD